MKTIVPARVKFPVYKNSINGFEFKFIDENDEPLDFNSYEKVSLVLFHRLYRGIETTEFEPVLNDNEISKELSTAETEEIFDFGQYVYEVRFYSDQENYSVYLIIDVEFHDVYQTSKNVCYKTIRLTDCKTELV